MCIKYPCYYKINSVTYYNNSKHKKLVSMIRKYHNNTPQTKPLHYGEAKSCILLDLTKVCNVYCPQKVGDIWT